MTPTPHINASAKDFAPTVLMPGDPLRARFIAENFLSDAVLVNNVRGVQGYTGTFEGAPVSVMASGMGMPSMGIYSHELFHFFGVENIIRVGSAGAISPKLRVRDVILAIGAHTDSSYPSQFIDSGNVAPTADYTLLRTAADIARELALPARVGTVLSSDVFYRPDPTQTTQWSKLGALAVEMEAAALYVNAAAAGKRALAILTVSDHLLTGEALDAEARQLSFTDMIRLALHTAKKMA